MTEPEKPESSGKEKDTETGSPPAPAKASVGETGDAPEAGPDAGASGADETAAPEAATAAEGDAPEPAAAPESPPQPEHPPAKIAPQEATAAGGSLAWIALILAVAAIALAAYQWWQGASAAGEEAALGAALATLRGELDDGAATTAGTLRELSDRADALQAAVAAAATVSRLEQLERRFVESADIIESLPGRMQNLEESLANLQGISAGARDAWLAAEAEYYMQLANAQVQLAGNAELAAFALELADQRIRELADPAYTPVRRLLAEEIAALKGVADVDVEGVSLTLASLGDIVQSLPLDEDITPEAEGRESPDETLTGAARAWAAVKGAFSDVVRVRRSDESLRPLLSPEAQFFLRTNIALQMQTARLALMKGEDEIFRQSIDDAESWLRRFFDDEDQAVLAAIATLGEIRQSEVSAELPDVSGSLRLFRQQRMLAEDAE